MARVGTTKFNLGQYEQGENPGPGSQDQSTYASNTGLNGNWAKIEMALTQHKTDGTHEDDIIDGRQMKASAADGASLEFSAGTGVKTLRVKALGIVTSMIADLSITLGKLAAACVDNSKLVSTSGSEAVNTNVMRDGCVTAVKIGTNVITALREAHDNNSRKMIIPFLFKATGVGAFAYFGDQQLSTTLGVPMPRGGSITRLVTVDNSAFGAAISSLAYSSSGGTHFNAGDKLAAKVQSASLMEPTINGTPNSSIFNDGFGGTLNIFVTMEVEFDD